MYNDNDNDNDNDDSDDNHFIKVSNFTSWAETIY